jgi:glycosyltransferase involved in cell wall biosynthesis
MVMIEALACGTPVVATPCGSVPELIDDGVTGFVRDGHDGLVEALGQVHELDRNTCRKVASDRFSSSRMVAQHVDLYRSIALSGDAARRIRPA